MTPKHIRLLVESKQRWAEPLLPDERELGFKGWHASRGLPHFDAPGLIQFVTFRLGDSMPASLRRERNDEREAAQNGTERPSYDDHLDKGYGECHLRDPRIAELVQDCLWHFDGIRYRLHAWVIMPNHVHVVVEVWQVPLHTLVQAWKGFTAHAANHILGRGGSFWQPDYFDQYIRDADHFQRVVRYTEWNPVAAGLANSPEEWSWSSARFRGAPGPQVPILTHPTATRTASQD